VKNAKPDGQTVIILPSGPMVLFPHVYKKLDYDAVKDFTPVSQIAALPVWRGSRARPRVPRPWPRCWPSAKADPKAATYGSPGLGTLPHFMGVLMEQSAGAAVHPRAVPGRRAGQHRAAGRAHRLQV
jgi:tripartite-type tricarboxylate transporter receptor subunit TctC